MPIAHDNATLKRFWAKVEKTETCWVWTAGTSEGYGHFAPAGQGSQIRAHRFAYEQLVGPIPEGLQLDHLCRNRLCVNPAHLEPVTRKENILRGECPPARQARKTHCHRGHPFSGDNLYLHPQGGRVCLTCKRAYERERYRMGFRR